MNIYALENHKVKYVGRGGEPVEFVELEIGQEYTVDRTDVGQSYTSVYLKEALGSTGRMKCFNSTLFRDVVEQSLENNKKHLQWQMWNRS